MILHRFYKVCLDLKDDGRYRQGRRFIVVGFLNVGVDLGIYTILLLLDMPIWLAKASAFIAGTYFSYVMNRWWSFSVPPSVKNQLAAFFMLYGSTLLLNVSINSWVVKLLGQESIAISLAYIAATGSSALLNFLGMRRLFSSGIERV